MEFTRHNFKNKEPEESNSKRNDNSRKRKHPPEKSQGERRRKGTDESLQLPGGSDDTGPLPGGSRQNERSEAGQTRSAFDELEQAPVRINRNFYVKPVAEKELEALKTRYGPDVFDVYKQHENTIARTVKPPGSRVRSKLAVKVFNRDFKKISPGSIETLNIRIPVGKVCARDILNYVDEKFRKYTKKSAYMKKVSVSFGSIIRVKEPDGGTRVKYFRPPSKSLTPELIKLKSNDENLSDKISPEMIEEGVIADRPDSSAQHVMTTNCEVKVFYMDRVFVGCGHMKTVVSEKKSIWDPLSEKRCSSTDNLCVFMCLGKASFPTDRRFKTRAERMAHEFADYTRCNSNAKAVTVQSLRENGLPLLINHNVKHLEICFKININVYSLTKDQPYLNRSDEGRRPILVVEHISCKKHGQKLVNLLIEGAHCLLIKDLNKLCPHFLCPHCEKSFSHKTQFTRHRDTCKGSKNYRYKARFVPRPLTVFDELEGFNIYIPSHLRRYPFRVTFDLETTETPVPESMKKFKGQSTEILGVQQMVSFSVVSNVPGFTEPYHKADETLRRPLELCKDFIAYLYQIKKRAAEEWHKSMDPFYEEIRDQIKVLGGRPYVHPSMRDEEEEEHEDQGVGEAPPQWNFNTPDACAFNPKLHYDEEDEFDDDRDAREIKRELKALFPHTLNFEKKPKYKYLNSLPLYNEEKIIPESIQNAEEKLRELLQGTPRHDDKSDDEDEQDIDDDNDDDDDDDNDDDDVQDVEQPSRRKKKNLKGLNIYHREKLNNLYMKLRAYCSLPVLGFNSSKFDLNVLREFLPDVILAPREGHDEFAFQQREHIIKKGSSYTMIQTGGGLTFLDVKNFVTPGLSLDKTLKTYKAPCAKGFFPYKLLSDTSFFEREVPPEYTDFYSSLKNMNTLESTWNEVMRNIYFYKWRPVVFSVAYGLLVASKGGYSCLRKTSYLNTFLFYILYDEGMASVAENMEPVLRGGQMKEPGGQCSTCGKQTTFVLPVSRKCMECYIPGPVTDEQKMSKVNVSKSRDDSFLTTYMWFLQQHTICTGTRSLCAQNTLRRDEWEMMSQEEMTAQKKKRHKWMENITTGVENYADMVKLWRDNRWKGRDFLRYYNDLDVVPLLHVVEKMCELEWIHSGIDCMKTNVSLPNIARIKVWKYAYDKGFYFSTFGKRHEDEERKQRRNAYGGPSIVFCREQLSGITRVNNAKGRSTEVVVGFDFNSLYPSCFLHNMPTGACCLYKRNAEGKWMMESTIAGSRKQFIWLDALNDELRKEYEAEVHRFKWYDMEHPVQKYFIRHERNWEGTLPKIGPFTPDGFRPRSAFLDWEQREYPDARGIVYEMNGCYWHGCECQFKDTMTREKYDLLKERQSKTQLRKLFIERAGYIVRDIKECEFDKLIKSPRYSVLRDLSAQSMPPYMLSVIKCKTKEAREDKMKIFDSPEAVMELLTKPEPYGPEIFGFMEVDIIDAEDRNKHFPLLFAPVEMDPRYKDPSKHMENTDKKHQTLLTGVTSVEKGTYSTEYLRFLINHGCKITKVYSVQEYVPKKALKELAETLSAQRGKGDKKGATEEDVVLALNAKITANSIYGALLMNKDKHEVISFAEHGLPLCKVFNNPAFRDADYVKEDVCEVTMRKGVILQDVPIQISKTVLDLAKMKISEFAWDVVDKYIDRDSYQFFQMDTDSLYIGLAGMSFEDCVKPSMKDEFDACKEKIFVQCECDGECENPRCDRRSLNKMKVENLSTHGVALTSKTHTEWILDPLHTCHKTSSKGIPAKNMPYDTFSMFYTVLVNGEVVRTKMENFQLERCEGGSKVGREVTFRAGITQTYNNKRFLLPDNVTTVGIPFTVYAGEDKCPGGIHTPQCLLQREERVQNNIRKIETLAQTYIS